MHFRFLFTFYFYILVHIFSFSVCINGHPLFFFSLSLSLFFSFDSLHNLRKVQCFFTREIVAVLKIVFKHYKFNCAIAWLVNGNGFGFFFFNVSLSLSLWVFENFHKKLVFYMKYDHIGQCLCIGQNCVSINVQTTAETMPTNWQFISLITHIYQWLHTLRSFETQLNILYPT